MDKPNNITTIKKATQADAKEILELQKLAYITEAKRYNDFSIEPLKQTLESMEQDIKNQTVLKAIMDNKIVGSVRAHIKKDNICYIGRLFVHPDYRRNGIGKHLMHNIESKFSKTTCFSLFTGDKSRENINLYMSLDYYPTKIGNYNSKNKIIHMEKNITKD